MIQRPSPDAAFGKMLNSLARRRAVLIPEPSPADGTGDRVRVLSEGIETVSATRAMFDKARAAGLIEQAAGGGGWRLSAKGRDTVRRWRSGGGAPELAARDTATVNDAESPLAWLRRRRGKTGLPLISEAQFAAGERLRADFTFAQMAPRVTVNWDAALGASGGGRRGGPGSGVDLADNAAAAAERVRRALKAVGPELSGILVDVCCLLKGLEELERQTGWPQRSGKVVLDLALTRLQRHYGMSANGAGDDCRPRVRHWGSDDYRPGLETSGSAAPHDDVA